MKYFFPIVFTIFFFGCSPNMKKIGLQIDEEYPVEYQRIRASVSRVVIEDQRLGISDRQIKVSNPIFDSSDDHVVPPVTPPLEWYITTEVEKHFVGGDSVAVYVELLSGSQEYTRSYSLKSIWINVSSFVAVKIAIVPAYSIPFLEPKFRGSCSIWESFDQVSEEVLDVVYKHAMSKAISECLSSYIRSDNGEGGG